MKKPTYTLGDLLDRHGILTRKMFFGSEEAISEHRYLERGMSAYGVNGKLITFAIKLFQINCEIWNLEHELRHGGEGKFTHEEIGKRAIRIRDLNNSRVEYKNKISELDKAGSFREVKINHRSK